MRKIRAPSAVFVSLADRSHVLPMGIVSDGGRSAKKARGRPGEGCEKDVKVAARPFTFA